MTGIAEHEARVSSWFKSMLDQAKRGGLFASPPFSDRRQESAWLAGYETALRDIATGKVKP